MYFCYIDENSIRFWLSSVLICSTNRPQNKLPQGLSGLANGICHSERGWWTDDIGFEQVDWQDMTSRIYIWPFFHQKWFVWILVFPYSFALFVSGEATSCRRPRPNCNERVRPAKNGRTGPGLILIIQWIVPDIIFASIQIQIWYKYMYEYLLNTGPGPKHIVMWIALNTISAWIQQICWGWNTAVVKHANNVRPMFSLTASSKGGVPIIKMEI